MTKQEAPEVKPVKKPVESRGRFIDFAPKRPKKHNPIEKPEELIEIEELEETTEKTEAPEKSVELSKAPEETPEEPAKRSRKPLINTSGIFDFIRPKATKKPLEESPEEVPEESPETVVEQVSITSISASTPRVSRHLTVADVIRPKRAHKPQVTAEEVADFADDVKKEKEPVATPEEIADFSDFKDDDLPPIDENDLAIALAGFADEPDSPGLSAPVPTDDLSREAADFAEEIDALDELATGDGDKIDDELAKALEIETEDFVSEPKPLFEKRTKESANSTAKAPIENEHVADQDFASGRGINYDPLVKDAEKAEEKARKRAEEKEKARIAKAKAEAPDGNMYTLGGRSPFLTSVHVEKRPLSQYVPSNMTSLETMANTPVKNTYRAKIKKALEDDAKEIHRQTLIVSAPVDSKTRSTALVFAIILTVLLGAGIGALVYLVFFQ